MKRRIEQLLNGIFEYAPAKLVIEPAKLVIRAVPGAAASGSFRVSAADHQKVKGFLYTSSPRMLCEPAEFQGTENDIRFQIDCSGFEEGAQEQGSITVCSGLGEYVLPYEVMIESGAQGKEADQVGSARELAAVAHESYQKACRIFATEEFEERLAHREPHFAALYGGLRVQGNDCAQVEEFLVGAGVKEPVEITAEQNSYVWDGLLAPVGQTIRIARNTWGYQQITASSDARFLRLEKKSFTTDEFAGSTYELNFVLDTNLMHAGNNYARILLTAGCQTVEIRVTARRAEQSGAGHGYHTCKIMRKELEALYVRFRLKKIDLATWVERSVSVIGSYKRSGGQDLYADLFLVQLYFADGKKQRALKLLESLDGQVRRTGSPERYGFYLYLTTFFYHEAAYVDRVEDEIVRLFMRDRTNWKLLWILLYLQENFLNNDDAKYEAIAEQFRYGCRSRILYLEAYLILRDDPFQMRRLDAFELQLLRFARDEGILTAEVVRQAANLAIHYPTFDQRLYEILTSGYQLYPSEDLVKAICRLLMKGDKKDSCFFPWYAKGVEMGLRVTGLYEYYMETMDSLDMDSMPQVIRMYFAYDTTLDYRRRAAIYRTIVENRQSDAQMYHSYRAAMEKFAVDQLEATRISDDLAVLYRTFLRKKSLTESSAKKLAKILFTYEIACNLPNIRQVIVHSARLRREQAALLVQGRAYVQIYDPDSAVMLEDMQGRRYLASGISSIRRMFEDEEMLAWCAQTVSDLPGLLLHICVRCMEMGPIQNQTLPYFAAACETEAFSDTFRARLRRDVMNYYVNHIRDDSLSEFLGHISYLDYVKVDKAALITLLAEEGKCADAFALLDAYGTEGIALLQLVRICSRMVLELEFEENSMLVSLCYYCFDRGKYDDKLLRYLLLYYEGPVRDMKHIWQAAVRFDLDTMLLEEKIITMILFTRSGTQGSEAVFESYWKKMGRKKLCKAYVNLKAYEYFVKDIPVADSVFAYIEREYLYLTRKNRAEEQEQVCRLALLQYYARSLELKPEQRKIAVDLLEEFGARGMRFAFWRRFDEELLRPYQMEGRVFAEYACDPKSKVTIFYRLRGREEEYREEAMKDYFEGIFVREFTLFDGDELECYLEEESGDERKKTDLWVLRAPSGASVRTSKYESLNRIARARSKGEEVREELESYLTMEYLVGEIFTLV